MATDPHRRQALALHPRDASPDVHPGLQWLYRTSSVSYVGDQPQPDQYLVLESDPIDEKAHVCKPGFI